MKDRHEQPRQRRGDADESAAAKRKSPDTVLQEERSVRERTARRGNFIEMDRDDPNDIDRLKGPL